MPVVFDHVQATIPPEPATAPPTQIPSPAAPAPPKPYEMVTMQRHLDRRSARLKVD